MLERYTWSFNINRQVTMQPLMYIAPSTAALAAASVLTAATPQEQWLTDAANRDHFIYFYDDKNQRTEFLGNFHKVPLVYNGLEFQCSEAAFQAAKFPHLPAVQRQFTSLDGDSAWRLAKQYASSQRSDWLHVNKDVMLEVLRAKYSQHPHLLRRLLATRNAYLVEHTPHGRDAFWGDNGDGTGQNVLGNLLMQVRGELGGTGKVPAPTQYYHFLHAAKPTTTAKVCALPGCIRPRYYDKAANKEHPFCGKSHAGEFLRRYKKIKCDLPGCDNPPFIETSGRVHDFCCKAHANLYFKK